MIFTSVTLNFGGSGGIITPVLFVGAAAGNVFGQLMHVDPSVFAAIGMVAVLAGAANTPIAASIMAVELFGPKVAPYASLACIISFLMTGHRSVYPSQILAFRKAPKIKIETDKEMGELEELSAKLLDHPRGFIGMFLRLLARSRRWFRRPDKVKDFSKEDIANNTENKDEERDLNRDKPD
jgi:hypothetical protein